jgi:hypothetical protein
LLLAVLCGFDPDREQTPGVSTFYDFFSRLWLDPGCFFLAYVHADYQRVVLADRPEFPFALTHFLDLR